MKRQFFALSMLLAFIATAEADAPPVTLPGTGISIVPPPGTALARAGSTLIDEAGTTVINFVFGERRFALDNDPVWRGVFPHPPEPVKGPWPAQIYQRTRAEDGGAWDGWMLSMVMGQKALTVMAMYTGTSPEAFQRLKAYVLTTAWREAAVDAETAVGVRLQPRGLKLVQGSTGGLSYNRTGVTGEPGRNLLIIPMPVTAEAGTKIFPSACESVIKAGLGTRGQQGPETVNKTAHSYCEGWSHDPQVETRYTALVRLNNGAVLSVMASAPPAEFAEALPVFRDAVATLRGLRSQ